VNILLLHCEEKNGILFLLKWQMYGEKAEQLIDGDDYDLDNPNDSVVSCQSGGRRPLW
jgi:hypothetical protein